MTTQLKGDNSPSIMACLKIVRGAEWDVIGILKKIIDRLFRHSVSRSLIIIKAKLVY